VAGDKQQQAAGLRKEGRKRDRKEAGVRVLSLALKYLLDAAA
jgi:hypothetical protein